MSKIKFRVWDKEFKKMVLPLMAMGSQVETIAVDLRGQVLLLQEDRVNDSAKIRQFLDSEIEVMQYTGVHDKTGKEIYEGDIIKHKTVFMAVEYLPKAASYVVSYHNIWKKLAHVPSLFYKKLTWGAERGEVIGNIYENPELLTEQK